MGATWVWIMVFLVMFTPYIVQCEQYQANRPTIDLPQEYHVKNYGRWCEECQERHESDGSCVHASLRMALHWQNQNKLADDWNKTYPGGGESFDSIKEKADPYIKYATGTDYAFLEKCMKVRRSPVIGISVKSNTPIFDFTVGYHSVIVVYADSEKTAIIDPNTNAHPYWMDKDDFMDIWMRWAIVPVYTPPPPTPWVEVQAETEILYFKASWCEPCKTQTPIMEALAEKYPGRVKIIDVDQNQTDYNVSVVPTMIVLTRGNETSRYTGLIPKSVLEEHLQ